MWSKYVNTLRSHVTFLVTNTLKRDSNDYSGRLVLAYTGAQWTPLFRPRHNQDWDAWLIISERDKAGKVRGGQEIEGVEEVGESEVKERVKDPEKGLSFLSGRQ